MSINDSLEDKLRSFLQLYWLRPENGLLTTFKSKIMDDYTFSSPSLDISCGDGLFMFLHLGGSFGFDFDYFKDTKAKDFSHESFVDIYNSFNETYQVPIKNRPDTLVDYGTDWKQPLLDKASKLSLFKNLILHDNNMKPLPLPDDYFKTIHSNSVYWVKNPEILLSEIHRVLNSEGVALLEVMTSKHFDTLENIAPYLSKKAIDILDRNRRASMPGLKTFEEWKDIMLKQNFEIVDIRNVYPNKLVMDIWNIGMRPISHLLIQMSEAMSSEERIKIKKEWVDIFFELFKPLLNLSTQYPLEESPYLLFVLKKMVTH